MTARQSLNIVLVGVGGQGTLVAGKLLGLVANSLGLDVKVSEVHGMAQRGGSVVTYVRMGEKVASPIVEPGTADFVLAFEEMEGLRWAHMLRIGGTLMINTNRNLPASVATGEVAYPENIVSELQAKALGQTRVYAFDALKMAEDAGSNRAVNLVLVGAMSRLTTIDPAVFTAAIDAVFPEKLRATNQRAFAAGSAIIEPA
jgi:indolepyruvate ferredoxin oxidoreductase beta subunit